MKITTKLLDQQGD